MLRIGKKKRIFLFQENFHEPFPRTYNSVLPTLRKSCPQLSRKLQKVSKNPQDFKTSIRKCCSVSVPLDTSKVFLTTLPKTFLHKHRFFLSKSKKHEKPIVQQFFWRFFLCTLRLLFQRTWLIFLLKSKKNSFKVSKEMIIVKNFWSLFLKVLLRTRKINFSNPAKFHKFFAKRRLFSLREQKRSNSYSSLQKKTSKRSAAPMGCSFEKFDIKFQPKVQ